MIDEETEADTKSRIRDAVRAGDTSTAESFEDLAMILVATYFAGNWSIADVYYLGVDLSALIALGRKIESRFARYSPLTVRNIGKKLALRELGIKAAAICSKWKQDIQTVTQV